MSGPLFSIVLPTYNRAGMLRSAIESVLWQTSDDYECFILDNHSTDETPRVFDEYAQHPRFHFKRFDANRGVQQSRNYAIGQAQGRYITFLDSDDLWLPQRLEAFAALIQERPSAGFIFSNAYEFRYGRIIGKLFDPARAVPEGKVPGYYAVGDSKLPYVTTNLAIRQEAFSKTGLYRTDIKLLDDTELYSRMLKDELEVAVIRQPLAVRTLHADQITHGHVQAFLDGMQSMDNGGAPSEVKREYREAIGLEVASHLLKAGKPAEARRFLSEQGVAGGWRGAFLRALSHVPAGPIFLARSLRRQALKLRYSRALTPREYRRVHDLIAPLLAPHNQ